MCPLNIAIDLGGYFLTLLMVKPGNPGRSCFWMAVVNECNGGDPKAA